jgi:hypothetical protein
MHPVLADVGPVTDQQCIGVLCVQATLQLPYTVSCGQQLSLAIDLGLQALSIAQLLHSTVLNFLMCEPGQVHAAPQHLCSQSVLLHLSAQASLG